MKRLAFHEIVAWVFTPCWVKVDHSMEETIIRRSAALVMVFLLLLPGIAWNARARAGERQVCDVAADYSLGVEDYPEALRLHAELVRTQPTNALAHYHLGFAQGMLDNRTAEIDEYQRAASLGLKNWDLFLNLGLAYLEKGDLNAASASLEQAVLLGENYPEPHYNLALVDERRGMLALAEREVVTSLRLNPWQPDARNLLGVIYAERGQSVRASLEWREVLREHPDYQPARANLALVGIQSKATPGWDRGGCPPPCGRLKTEPDQRKTGLAHRRSRFLGPLIAAHSRTVRRPRLAKKPDPASRPPLGGFGTRSEFPREFWWRLREWNRPQYFGPVTGKVLDSPAKSATLAAFPLAEDGPKTAEKGVDNPAKPDRVRSIKRRPRNS